MMKGLSWLVLSLLASSASAEDSLYPLKCGTYQVFASALISSSDGLRHQAILNLAEGTLSQSRLAIEWPVARARRFPARAWVKGEVQIYQQENVQAFKGRAPAGLEILPLLGGKAWQESVILFKETPCTP